MHRLHLVWPALLLLGCQQDEGEACTTAIVYGIEIEINNPGGGKIDDVTVLAGLFGEELEPCEGDGRNFSCAPGLSGSLEVMASAPGYESNGLTINVDDDGCHPITQSLELSLSPVKG
ncbi:MAG: hypothetical protein ACON5B_15145 [Myxococcota bacterium]